MTNREEIIGKATVEELAKLVPAERLAEALSKQAPGHRSALESTLLVQLEKMLSEGTAVCDRKTGEAYMKPIGPQDALQIAKTLATMRLTQQAAAINPDDEAAKNVVAAVDIKRLASAVEEDD